MRGVFCLCVCFFAMRTNTAILLRHQTGSHEWVAAVFRGHRFCVTMLVWFCPARRELHIILPLGSVPELCISGERFAQAEGGKDGRGRRMGVEGGHRVSKSNRKTCSVILSFAPSFLPSFSGETCCIYFSMTALRTGIDVSPLPPALPHRLSTTHARTCPTCLLSNK